MKGLAPCLGWGIFLGAIGCFRCKYGRQFEFGRYWMPRPLIGPNWLHPDGTPPDGLVISIYSTGAFEEIILCSLLALVALGVWFARECRRLDAKREALFKLLRKLDEEDLREGHLPHP